MGFIQCLMGISFFSGGWLFVARSGSDWPTGGGNGGNGGKEQVCGQASRLMDGF